MTDFRILMVAACPFPARRGTPVRIERLAQSLAKSGHQVDIATYAIGETEHVDGISVHRIGKRYRQGTIPPGPTAAKLLSYDPALARKLRHMLAERRYDIIHAHHVEGLMTAAWARRGLSIPLVFDVHTMLGSELPFYHGGPIQTITRSLGNRLDRWLPTLADHVVTVTPDIRNLLMLQHGVPGRKISVAMNGVEAERFIHHDRYPDSFDRLVYTGTLAPYQGIDDMLNAFALAHRQRRSLRLAIIASDPFEGYENQARSLGIRQAIDVIQDDFERLPQRLAGQGVALMPRANCDGVPQKLLNYLAAGRPVIAFEGSAKVAIDNKAGIVVANHNIVEFADAILSMANNPARSRAMGEYGRFMAEQQFSWMGTAQVCELAYRKIGPGVLRPSQAEARVTDPEARLPEVPNPRDAA